ncbi:MAG: hypothetical protein PUB21_08020 [Bacteroidales bacterium]|nr:hypothetical protein [Bacteroidales bacterium]
MALQKEIKSKSGVTGNYMAVHAVSYDNENKSAAYSVALYVNEEEKKNGAEPLGIIYQGLTEKIGTDNIVSLCYEDLKYKAAYKQTETVSNEEGEEVTEEYPVYPIEYNLFFDAVDV